MSKVAKTEKEANKADNSENESVGVSCASKKISFGQQNFWYSFLG